MAETADVVVIGGAAHGSSVAYWLSANRDFGGRVIVLEKDPTYRQAASALSTSGVRQQFSSPPNIALSRFTLEFLAEVEDRLGRPGESTGIVFHQHGYLFLGGPDAVPAFEANNRTQRAMGVDVRLLEPAEIARRFPWLNLEDVAIGSFVGHGEGWIDGYILLNAFRRRARANGVEYRKSEAVGLLRDGDRITGVRCRDGSEIAARHVVNAAGGGGPTVAAMAGLELPIRIIKQMIYSFRSPFRAENMPFVFTPDRLLFRPEGADYISGIGVDAETSPPADEFEVDHGLFEDRIWPMLANRVTGFEEARMTGAWAGHYDMNMFDHNAIVGTVPGLAGFYLANGFSGHGLMHSPGVGRALSELIVYGAYRTLDISDLGYARVLAGTPIRESIQY